MQSQLKPDTPLFAGRYIITNNVATTAYGYTYTAIDRSNDSEVFIQEFFPLPGCHRAPDTLNMTIRREHAQAVSALYKDFTRYVSALKDNPQKGKPRLLHAFKDHGTAYYVTSEDDSSALSRPGMPPKPAERPTAAAPAKRANIPDAETRPRRSVSETSYRNAILWYRIVIFLLVCIVALLVYLCFLTPSPKVKSAHTPQPALTEIPASLPADSL